MLRNYLQKDQSLLNDKQNKCRQRFAEEYTEKFSVINKSKQIPKNRKLKVLVKFRVKSFIEKFK